MASSKAWINVEKKSMNGKSVRVGACLLVDDIVKMVNFYRDVGTSRFRGIKRVRWVTRYI